MEHHYFSIHAIRFIYVWRKKKSDDDEKCVPANGGLLRAHKLGLVVFLVGIYVVGIFALK